MSAGSVLSPGSALLAPPRPTVREAQPAVPDSPLDPVAALAEEFAPVCAAAVDADEVAVALEASGMGDRVALDSYGRRSVFALAEDLLARVPRRPAPPPPPRPRHGSVAAGRQVLLRSTLYLTPLALALGLAHQFDSTPVWVTAGALVAGWSTAQGLAYLAYRVAGRGGTGPAARFLLTGFTVLAMVWTAALVGTSVAGMASQPGGLTRAVSVSLGELALFAAVSAGLVTCRERELVRAAVPCWAVSAALAWGPALLGGGHRLAWVETGLVAGTVARFLFVAYRPALGPFRREDWRWSLALTEVTSALGHAVVGAAQAVLFVAAMLAGVSAEKQVFGAMLQITTAPLLIGAFTAEYLMLRHRARLEHALETSTDRVGFQKQLFGAVCWILGVLALAVVSGLAAAVNWAATDLISGLQLACGVLLAGLSVLTLVLTAHGKLRLAAVLVGSPATLAVSVAVAVVDFGMVLPQPSVALSYAAAVLATALGLGFLAALRALLQGQVRL
jgi:hypothetical protein